MYPTSEKYIRDLARTFSSVLPLVSNDIRRIDIEYSGDCKTFIIVHRAGGNVSEFVNYDEPTIVFNCYGSTRNNALNLSKALVEELSLVRHKIVGDAYIASFGPASIAWIPDQQHPRYVVQSTARVYSAPTAVTGGTGA